MSFNELLTEAGDFGLYQKIFCIGFVWSSMMVAVFTYWTNVFILLVAPHRCRLSPNDTWESNITLQPGIVVGKCDVSFNVTGKKYFLGTEDNTNQNDLTDEIENSTWTTIPCPNGWVYDFSTFYPTISTEKDWVCENSWKMYILHSCYWAGAGCAFAFFGSISDRFGRKRTYQACVLLTLISDVAAIFVNSRTAFMIARFFSAMGQGIIPTLAFVLGIEYTGPRKRLFVLAGWCLTWTSHSALFPLVPYLLRYWRWLLAASTVPCIIVLLLSNFVPESASWLITRGRIDEASRLIQRVSKVNGRKLDLHYIKEKLEAQSKHLAEVATIEVPKDNISKERQGNKASNEEQLSYIQAIYRLFKTPNLRKKTVLLLVIWMVSSVCYNGNSIEVSNLPFNLYLSYTIGALLELPANICCLLTLDKIGRRWANFVFLLTTGILGITSGLLKTDSPIVLALALLMRTSISGCYDTTFTFSSESFPTVVRGRGIGIIRIFGALACCVAPFIVSLSAFDPLLPLAIFGALSVFAGCATLFIPETARQHLPHTLEEGEEYGKDQIFFFCPFTQQKTRGATLTIADDEHPRRQENGVANGRVNPAMETDD